MSWEYTKYEAQCANCGRQGFCIIGSDDWNRTSRSWEGFSSKEPDATAVARKRADKRDSVAICDCGHSKIALGKIIED